jgi:hypothetical protein
MPYWSPHMRISVYIFPCIISEDKIERVYLRFSKLTCIFHQRSVTRRVRTDPNNPTSHLDELIDVSVVIVIGVKSHLDELIEIFQDLRMHGIVSGDIIWTCAAIVKMHVSISCVETMMIDT